MPRGSKLAVPVVAAVIAFAVVAGARSSPSHPGARLPQSTRLSDLIAREQATSAQLQRQADQLRRQVDAQRTAAAGGPGAGLEAALSATEVEAGLRPAAGAGLRVTLDDSSLATSPSGDLNDLVIHSQDVQAVVNALWKAGATAIAINGQRLVSTSAVLCVGNTLLLDGTVHSPPYVVEAIGADRTAFDDDALVRRLHHDADVVHLGFAVEHVNTLNVPGYPGPLTLTYAVPSS